METGGFPTSIAELAAWRQANRATGEEARRRLVQFVVLASIGTSPGLVRRLALKGGNALRLAHGNRRSTIDLDFTAQGDFPDDADAIRSLLDAALLVSGRRFQVKSRCQSVRRNPKNPEATLPTYAIKVGFQLPGDRHYQDFERRASVVEVVELEISLNDVICEIVERTLGADTVPVRVCSLEDILAEKLRALLQQAIRGRNRPQDVYDIASRMREVGPGVDIEKLARFLLIKSTVRGIDPRKSSYNEAVRRLALQNYEAEIRAQATEFLPFDEAWQEVLALVNRLDIPE